jgi:hypothetical protein
MLAKLFSSWFGMFFVFSSRVRRKYSSYLKGLVRIGVLEEKEAGKERLFINPRLLLLLTRETNQTDPYHE